MNKITINKLKKMNLEFLYKYALKIEYGWIDTKGQKHYCSNSDDKEYHLQTPEETLERNIAICWDKTELLRYYFLENGYEVHTYFIYLYITDDYCPSHSIITYKEKNKYIWFEPSRSKKITGIRVYQSEKELINDLKIRFIENGIRNHFFEKTNDFSKLVCYEYKKPPFHIKGSEFYNHCRTGKKVI